jgi:hypothetical protein
VKRDAHQAVLSHDLIHNKPLGWLGSIQCNHLDTKGDVSDIENQKSEDGGHVAENAKKGNKESARSGHVSGSQKLEVVMEKILWMVLNAKASKIMSIR